MTTLSFIVADEPLTVHSLPNNSSAHAATKLIRRGYHLSFLSPSGKMFSTRVGSRSGAYGRRWFGHAELVSDAKALGVLTKKITPKLIALEMAHRMKQRAKYAAENVTNAADSVGLTFTPAQKAKIKKAAAYRGRKENF